MAMMMMMMMMMMKMKMTANVVVVRLGGRDQAMQRHMLRIDDISGTDHCDKSNCWTTNQGTSALGSKASGCDNPIDCS
jgi:hypothetical protein